MAEKTDKATPASIKDAQAQQKSFKEEEIKQDAQGRESVASNGDEGGFFVPGSTGSIKIIEPQQPPAATPPAKVQLPNLSQDPQPAVHQTSEPKTVEQLQAEIDQLKGQQPLQPEQSRSVEPSTVPPPTQTPMFGNDITQPVGAPVAAASTQQQPPQQPPPQNIPPDASVVAATEALSQHQDPNLSSTVYIGQGKQGLALVLDGLQQNDLDRFSLMGEYLHANHPDVVPAAHPAFVVKFALQHLMITIRTNIAESVVCADCNDRFIKTLTHCPTCGAINACPACGKLIGNSKIFL